MSWWHNTGAGTAHPAAPTPWAPLELTAEDLAHSPERARVPDESPDPQPDPHEQVELRLAEAYARGYEEGRLAGERHEASRLRSAMAAAEALLDELHVVEERSRGLIEENICALAVSVARQLLGRELRGEPDAVVELVRRAVQEFPIDQSLAIRLNPSDLALLTAATATDGSPLAVAPGRETRWIADGTVATGGVVVEGRDRVIDGRVDLALERVYRRLTHTHA